MIHSYALMKKSELDMEASESVNHDLHIIMYFVRGIFHDTWHWLVLKNIFCQDGSDLGSTSSA